MTNAADATFRLVVLEKRNLTIATWACALVFIAIFPVFLFSHPGLQDYPNHLARTFILTHLGDPIFREYYASNLAPVPNLGWDIFSIVASRFLTLSRTGQLFIVLSCVTLVTGCFALNRAIVGRWTIAPLFVLPFVFNTGFNKGFLSFNLGIGVSLWAAAWWVSLDEHRWRLRLIGAFFFSCLLYFIHFYAWACYGIFLLGWTLTQATRDIRDGLSSSTALLRVARDGLQAIPPALFAAITLFLLKGEEIPPTEALRHFEPPYSRISDLDRLIDLGTPFINDVLLIVTCAAFLYAVFTGNFRYKGGSTASIVLCVILFFTLPSEVEQTSYVSWRILFAGLLFLFSSLDSTAKLDQKIFPIFAIAIAAVTIAISILHIRQWDEAEHVHTDLSHLIAPIPDGSAIFMAHSGHEEKDLGTRSAGLYHIGAFAVIEKRALLQSLFTFIGQQPLRYKNLALQNVPDRTNTFLNVVLLASVRESFDFRSHIERFDYVVIHGHDIASYAAVLPLDKMRLLSEIGEFKLYRIVNSDPASKFSRISAPPP